MPSKTTIVVILLASDDETVKLLDPLLYEIQCGVNGWGLSPADREVICLYHRRISPTDLQTSYFPITCNTLQFHPRTRMLLNFPPASGNPLSGPLDQQIEDFVSLVRPNPTDEGPIRIILGAHGFPGLGYGASRWEQYLWILSSLLLSSLDKKSAWLSALLSLPFRRTPVGAPPGGFASQVGQRTLDLTTDRLAEILSQLPRAHRETLIIHTCTHSSIETISGLRSVPYHIACASPLSPCMPVSSWFPILGDPNSCPEVIGDECLTHLDQEYTGDGCFSAHHTDGIDLVLEKLDAVGAELRGMVTPQVNQTAVDAIVEARAICEITTNQIDAAQFCMNLKQSRSLPPALHTSIDPKLQELFDSLKALQTRHCVRSGTWRTYPPEDFFKAIGVYLPERGAGESPTSKLPCSIQTLAPAWCEFVDLWRTLSY